MTLSRQITLVIITCFTINLMGVLWLEFDTTRNYLTNQLESDLNNTTTSLSMAILPHIQTLDPVLLESTINAYFDGGFYEKIEVELWESKQTMVKQIPIQIQGVPDWFVNLNLLNITEVKTILTDGWLQVGELTIKGHPGFAYKQLWEAFIAMTIWMLCFSLLMIGLAITGIHFVLRPLKLIQKKAEEIQVRHFGEPLMLPKTKELKSVTHAFNQMTEKLKEQFSEEARLHDKLKKQAFQDATTGLGNRAFFNRQLHAWLSEQANGAVIIIELLDLDTIKKKDGFNQRDEIVKMASHLMTNTFNLDNGDVVCRLSANEFAIIANGTDQTQLITKLNELNQVLQSPHFKSKFYVERISHIGAVIVNQMMEASQLLAMADQALQKARGLVEGIQIIHQVNPSTHILSKMELKNQIENAIINSQIEFTQQAVFHYKNQQHPIHMEIFAQLKLNNSPAINAGAFISVLDEFELGELFDKKVIELLLQYIQSGGDNVYAINLTASALKNEAFIKWIVVKLNEYKSLNKHICFEFSEESAIYNRKNIEFLSRSLKQLNISFGVDRVGRNFSSLSYLQSIQPNYVKIDHAYTQMALSNKDDAYFVGSLCTTIHNLDVEVIATRVENEAQLNILKEYHFDAYQGFIYKPEAFSVNG